MTYTAADVPVILTASLAAVFSYLCIRRFLWPEDEAQDAARWYSQQRQWEVRKEDVVVSAEYIRISTRVFGVLALAFWALTWYLGTHHA